MKAVRVRVVVECASASFGKHLRETHRYEMTEAAVLGVCFQSGTVGTNVCEARQMWQSPAEWHRGSVCVRQ
jgi:hypothetical protein